MKVRTHIAGALLLATIVLLSACERKELPVPSADTPLFSVSGTVGGESIELAAGQNDMYLFTRYDQDENNVYSFVGELKDANCPNLCGPALGISIRDNQVSQEAGLSAVEQSLQTKQYAFRASTDLDQPEYVVQFTAEPFGQGAVSVYEWEFGDGSTSNERNPEHRYPADGLDNYEVRFSVLYLNTCKSEVRNVVYMPSYGCRTYFYEEEPLLYVAAPAGGKEFSADWASKFFGYPGQGKEIKYSLPPSSDYPPDFRGIDLLTLETLDDNNCFARMRRHIVVDSNEAKDYPSEACAANFNYDAELAAVLPQDTLDFSEVTITWVSESGVLYSSFDVVQPSSSRFEIVAVDDYETNEMGEQTKRIEFNVTCLVKAANGSLLKLEGIKGAFAAAYPAP